MERTNYYAVEAKCGHVGRTNCIIITFPVCAESKKDAASIARNFPRVKRDHKDAIVNVTPIDYEEYMRIVAVNDNDPYLHCKSSQEQNSTCSDLEDRIMPDLFNIAKMNNGKAKKKHCVAYHRRKESILKECAMSEMACAY